MKAYDKFFEGEELYAYELFGAHKKENGVEFTVFAPHADSVSVFTSKENFTLFRKLEKIDERGIWQLYIEDMEIIYSYRYRIYKGDKWHDKSDPFAFYSEKRPDTASCMYDLSYYKFTDSSYMKNRKASYDEPVNIYEVHLNGFMKEEGKDLSSYRYMTQKLIPYVKSAGFTHIELMPVFEHPFDGSWGYQASGFFSATSRYGTPYDLMEFIDTCHKNNIGVILDVVYAHFVKDAFGLCDFDHMPLYEYEDMKYQYSQWDTYYFDLTKGYVISFLLSSANFFLKEYHFDGLRFDAVSNFIYHDGNRDKGENSEGLLFLKKVNTLVKKENKSCLIIAEDSTDFEGVTKSVDDGGLGFDYKWDLGWMNDTLKYYATDPYFRRYDHNLITFSMAYFYSERFLLPFSHDEVVHSKKTIIDKIFGSYEDKFSQCRNLYLYMFSHPGKKLNFMGNEIAMFREFDETKEVDWDLLKYPIHDSFNRFFTDLCAIYRKYPAFYRNEYDWNYYKWIDADNNGQSIFSFYREDSGYVFVTVLNMLKTGYEEYKIGVPYKGKYTEIINSDKDIYGGGDMINEKDIITADEPYHGLPCSIRINLAPFCGLILKYSKKTEKKDIDKDGTAKKETGKKAADKKGMEKKKNKIKDIEIKRKRENSRREKGYKSQEEKE